MPSVLFVCTANICRSPVAEVLFRDWLRRRAVPGDWQVGSAGTWAMPGEPASVYSQQVAAARGLSLAQHEARPVDEAMLAAADVVLCMARGHCEALLAEFPQHGSRLHVWTALAGPAYDIADPYGGPLPGYVAMAREMEALIEKTGGRVVALALEGGADRGSA
jgi:protein-tyrosine-phosphatase